MNTYAGRLSVGNEGALVRLHHWSAAAPDDVALLHKRRGRWKAFRWTDAENEVARLTETLAEHGFGSGSRLAVSGAYEPDLIFIALAATALGGSVLPAPRNMRGDELASFRPTHAFVKGRRTLAHWAELRAGDSRLPLFCSQPDAQESEQWQMVPTGGLPETAASQPRNLRRRLRRRAVAWVDEGTEWTEGLNIILGTWLKDGSALAFPEAEGSVARDRKEIRPSALLSSQARRQALSEEINQRLGIWNRRLAEARPRHPLARLIIARRNAVLGLGRLLPAEEQQP
jgi:hypothetical protein